MAVETCPVCGFKIEDNHELWEYHVMNTHPSTKACTKCSGTAYYRYYITKNDMDVLRLFSYICADCGFVLETWKAVEGKIMGFGSDNVYMPEKRRSKPYYKID